MQKIYCSITVAVEHDDDPKAAIKANNAILSLIRHTQKLGKTNFATHSVNGAAPEPGTAESEAHPRNPRNPAAEPDPDFADEAVDEGPQPEQTLMSAG